MEYLTCIMMAISTGAMAYCIFEPKIYAKLKIISANSTLNDIEKSIALKKKILMTIMVAVLGGWCGFLLGRNALDWIIAAKLLIAVFCVTGSACVDYLEHRIPNVYPAFLALASLILLTVGYFTGQEGSIGYITSSVFACIVCGLALIATALMTKGGIGAGDIKLLCAVALAGGVEIVIYTIFVGMTSCAIISGLLLLLKKKTIHDFMPFGPFMYLGLVASIIIIFI